MALTSKVKSQLQKKSKIFISLGARLGHFFCMAISPDDFRELLKVIRDDNIEILMSLVPTKFSYDTIFPTETDPNLPEMYEKHSLLTLAAEFNRPKSVCYLVENGCNINYYTLSGYTALHYAVLNDNIELMNFLLGCENLDKNIPTVDGFYPLHIAARHGYEKIVEILLSNKIYHPDLMTNPKENNDQTQNNNDGFQVNIFRNDHETSLIIALKEGKASVVNVLLKYGASPALPSSTSMYPLHAAVYGSQIQCLKLLLSYQIDINCRDNDGYTPLLLAAKQNKLDNFLLLLEQPNIDVNATANDGNNFLFFNVNQSIQKFLPFLKIAIEIENFNLNYQNPNGDTILHILAAKDRQMEVLFILGNLGGSKDNNSNAHNPINDFLHKIIYKNKPKYTYDPVSRCDPNITNKQGKTPLDVAIENRSINVATILLGCDRIILTEAAKRSNLPHLAANCGISSIFKHLIERGFDIDSDDGVGSTPLMVAAMKSQENVVRTLLGSRKVDINKHNSIGQNALLIAAMSKSGETIVRMMLCHPLIQVNVENDHGETPLLNAIRCYNPNIVDALLENEKVDPNYVSKNECIPFLEAVRSGNIRIITSFIFCEKVNINVIDEDHSNALHYAIETNDIDIVNLLITHGVNLKQKSLTKGMPLEYAIKLEFIPLADIIAEASEELITSKPVDVSFTFFYQVSFLFLSNYR